MNWRTLSQMDKKRKEALSLLSLFMFKVIVGLVFFEFVYYVEKNIK